MSIFKQFKWHKNTYCYTYYHIHIHTRAKRFNNQLLYTILFSSLIHYFSLHLVHGISFQSILNLKVILDHPLLFLCNK